MGELACYIAKTFTGSQVNSGSATGTVLKRQRRSRRSFLLGVVFVVASFVAVTAKKVFDYAAAPDHDPPAEKNGRFRFPADLEQEKPVVLYADANSPGFTFRQVSGFANDASHLNQTAIYGVARIGTEDD